MRRFHDLADPDGQAEHFIQRDRTAVLHERPDGVSLVLLHREEEAAIAGRASVAHLRNGGTPARQLAHGLHVLMDPIDEALPVRQLTGDQAQPYLLPALAL
jgi:hypothetical protein